MGDPAVALLDDLRDLLDADEDYLLVTRVVGLERDSDELRLRLRVEWYEGHSDVTVTCAGAIRWVVEDTEVDQVRVEHDHPALLPFSAPRGALYFKGRPADTERLLGRLRAAHAAAEPYVRLHETFAEGLSADRLDGGHGHLARGPVVLLETFAGLLREEGVSPSVVVTSEPESRGLTALVLGDSYVVAASFEAEGDLSSVPRGWA